jgi:hypothetical protein
MTVKITNKSGKYTNLPSITYHYYWSSTENSYITNIAYRGSFNHGNMSGSDKDSKYLHTICIHG